MSWFRASIGRRIAAALALLGVLAYATLLPWHVSSSFAARSLERDLLSALHVICLPGQTTLALAETGLPDAPVEHETGCPICKGLASLHLAVLPTGVAAVPPPAVSLAFATFADEAGAPAHAVNPKSRGPPLA